MATESHPGHVIHCMILDMVKMLHEQWITQGHTTEVPVFRISITPAMEKLLAEFYVAEFKKPFVRDEYTAWQKVWDVSDFKVEIVDLRTSYWYVTPELLTVLSADKREIIAKTLQVGDRVSAWHPKGSPRVRLSFPDLVPMADMEFDRQVASDAVVVVLLLEQVQHLLPVRPHCVYKDIM